MTRSPECRLYPEEIGPTITVPGSELSELEIEHDSPSDETVHEPEPPTNDSPRKPEPPHLGLCAALLLALIAAGLQLAAVFPPGR